VNLLLVLGLWCLSSGVAGALFAAVMSWRRSKNWGEESRRVQE
jgi:hypothetical protein